jgi:hypothetical protein
MADAASGAPLAMVAGVGIGVDRSMAARVGAAGREDCMRSLTLLALLVLVAISVPGCAAIAGIFKAGMWTGVIMVIIVVAIIGFVASMIRG